jgi:hypothetical protein
MFSMPIDQRVLPFARSPHSERIANWQIAERTRTAAVLLLARLLGSATSRTS